MSNTITIELCEQDRQRLDLLTAILEANTQQLYASRNACTALPEVAPEIPQQEEAPEAEQPREEKPAEEEKPAHTLADIRALAQTLLAPGSNKRAQTKEIVSAYATKISDIPADKVDEVWQKLTELKEA